MRILLLAFVLVGLMGCAGEMMGGNVEQEEGAVKGARMTEAERRWLGTVREVVGKVEERKGRVPLSEDFMLMWMGWERRDAVAEMQFCGSAAGRVRVAEAYVAKLKHIRMEMKAEFGKRADLATEATVAAAQAEAEEMAAQARRGGGEGWAEAMRFVREWRRDATRYAIWIMAKKEDILPTSPTLLELEYSWREQLFVLDWELGDEPEKAAAKQAFLKEIDVLYVRHATRDAAEYMVVLSRAHKSRALAIVAMQTGEDLRGPRVLALETAREALRWIEKWRGFEGTTADNLELRQRWRRRVLSGELALAGTREERVRAAEEFASDVKSLEADCLQRAGCGDNDGWPLTAALLKAYVAEGGMVVERVKAGEEAGI